METRTLESYFIEDYERVKAENEDMKARLHELEDRGRDFGVTDLHCKFHAVKGSVCSRWMINCYMLNNGKMTVEQMRRVMEMDDEALFNKYKNKTAGYYNVIDYEEHEFQYTLFIKESRIEWTAVTDGNKNDTLRMIEPRKMGEELCEDKWYPIGEAEALRTFLAQNLRNIMEEALDEYEREQAEKEETDEGAV